MNKVAEVERQCSATMIKRFTCHSQVQKLSTAVTDGTRKH